MQKKHIIWDFNGTLLNDAQLSVDCDNHVFDVLGLPHITIEDYRAHMTMPVRDFYTALGIDLNVYKYETIARIWLDMFNENAVNCGLVPGALASIDRLHAAGHSQSILSASYEPDLLTQCAGLGLARRMTVINGLGDESARKKTDIGRAQMQALGLEGRDVVLVGDMLADAELARALGASCVLVPWGHNAAHRLEGAGFPVARSFEELEAIIEGL
ncbi:MAG: HAD family hydrolase [Clostridia bacterium]|nr:HAD family hydrolase [Clostridia bacterium]